MNLNFNIKVVQLSLLVVLSVWVRNATSYNVYEEIEELKKHYGEKIVDKPLSYDKATTNNITSRTIPAGGTYCHEKLGCFPTDGPFSQRLVNFNPSSRETVNTKFKLLTRANQAQSQPLVADNPTTIKQSLFDSSKRTIFVIHGFLESTYARWYPRMNQELLKNGDYNVINVDWGGFLGSKTLYTQATANTRVVAAEIVYLLKTLQKGFNLSLKDVHLVGHSLGAHISGYVGANLTGIGRITGLDPADPYFQGYTEAIRLDPSDAIFVDIIHSDADSILEIVKGGGGLGTKDLSGHVDFFPNGGEAQPNCKNGIVKNLRLEKDLYEGLKRFVACDHNRAISYFEQSINNCPFTAILCPDYRTTDQCNSMGFKAHKPSTNGFKRYYLDTRGEGNFCSYRVKAKLTVERDSKERVGTVDLDLYGTYGNKQTVPLTPQSGKFKPSNSYEYQISISEDIKLITALEVVWKEDVSWWRILTKTCKRFSLCSNSIKIREISFTSPTGSKLYFCGSGLEFSSGKAMRLHYSSTSCV